MKKLLWTVSLILLASMLVLSGCSTSAPATEQEADQQQEEGFKKLTTDELTQNLKSSDWIFIDARDTNAFNGWALDGAKRGGHIEGAVEFSANWINVDVENKDTLLKEELVTKKITNDKNIAIYDVNGKDAVTVAEYLTSQGYENLYLYDLNEWINDDSKELVKYEGYKWIVPAAIVKDIIDGKKPETFEGADTVKMIEASWGEAAESYDKGHIPGAIHINTDWVEPPPAWMMADDETLLQVMLDNGISANDTVVVSSEYQMAAYRVALVLRYAGVKDVRVLNGGTGAWTLAGYELETTANQPTPITDFGGPFPGNPDIVDTIEEVKAMLETENFTLVDNRTWDEYIGKVSGYSYHDKMGRIPGAKFGYAGKTDSNSLDYYRNIDNTMRNFDEILAMWKEYGIDTANHLSFMCGSGWRAAEVLYYANVAGFDNVSLYSDGWIGWSNAGLPSETGEPAQ